MTEKIKTKLNPDKTVVKLLKESLKKIGGQPMGNKQERGKQMKYPDCYKCIYERGCMSSACSQCKHPDMDKLNIKLKKDDGSPHRNNPRESKYDPYYIKECSGYIEKKQYYNLEGKETFDISCDNCINCDRLAYWCKIKGISVRTYEDRRMCLDFRAVYQEVANVKTQGRGKR